MAGVNNNLYPPIIDTYMPAFIRTQECRVYFSLSLYNSIGEIKNAQVLVNNQNTNLTALDPTKYPSGIKIDSIKMDVDRETDDKYYVSIYPNDLIDGIFNLNQYYKVQIRFTDISAPDPPEVKIDSWLSNNLKFFSEWSTVCLIKGISKPQLNIKGFDSLSENNSTVFTTSTIDFIGNLSFEDESETETLKSYRIRLYDVNGTLLTDSRIIYSNIYSNVNEINYTFKYSFMDGEQYQVVFDYTTRNLYTNQYKFSFTIIQYSSDKLDATIEPILDEKNGRIGIHLKSNSTEPFSGNITIRRTSSKSNFLLWEDVNTTVIAGQEPLEYTWYDYTVESGVWYKYCAQRRNSLGNRGVIIEIEEPVMIMPEDMFLTGSGVQLNIKYDSAISSFKHTVSESRTDTIGSKYPFIKRNGYTNYRQFPISGLITFFCDEDGILTSKEKIFQESLLLYNKYNEENNIGQYNDYIYEREFRKVVMDFLYNGDTKLFRSTTEGNIIVKLMDINLIPQATLGRYIYSFSCTAYEIDEYSIENCDKYNIQKIGTYSELIQYSHSVLGQLDQTFAAGSKNDLTVLLQEKYKKLAVPGFMTKVQYLTFLRLEFYSKPYLIKEVNGIPRALRSGEKPDNTTILGYIVYINNIPIVIGKEGIYELKDSDTKVTSVYFPVSVQATIDYVVQLSEEEDLSNLAKIIYYYNKIGQCWGSFSYKDSIFKRIWNKYYEKYTTYYQTLVSINGIRVEANPGTVVYVKDSKDTEINRHVIGETCTLELYDEESVIEGLYFAGIHLEEAEDFEKDRDEIPSNKFIDTGIIADSFEDIENPIKNGIYIVADHGLTVQALDEINNLIHVTEDDVELIADSIYALLLERIINESNRYIYYQGEWRIFTPDNDILGSVEGLVDYYCEVLKGKY